MDKESKSLITLTQAAHSLRVSGERARRMMLTGQLEGEQICGRWFIASESVESAREELAKVAHNAA